jgi:hypothetical protein
MPDPFKIVNGTGGTPPAGPETWDIGHRSGPKQAARQDDTTGSRHSVTVHSSTTILLRPCIRILQSSKQSQTATLGEGAMKT